MVEETTDKTKCQLNSCNICKLLFASNQNPYPDGLAARLDLTATFTDAVIQLNQHGKQQFFKQDLQFIIKRFRSIQSIIATTKTHEFDLQESIYTSNSQESPINILQRDFNFVFSLLEATILQKDCQHFLYNHFFNEIRLNLQNSEIKLDLSIQKRALKLVDLISYNLLEFTEIFQLDYELGENYFLKRSLDALNAKEYFLAGKIVLQKKLTQKFDCLDLCMKLGEKGAKNRELAINILQFEPQHIDAIIFRFSTENEFQFASDVVTHFNLKLQNYHDLEIIKQSRHPIVDMAFTDPEKDSKHVPLHVMEDLISGDERLLKKFFFALVKNNTPHRAIGLYIRNKFAEWAPKQLKQVLKSLPKYDSAQDVRHFDQFAPYKQSAMRLPDFVQLHWIGNPSDVSKLQVLIGKEFVGVDAEWRCNAVNAFQQGGDKGPAIIQLSSDTDACIVDLINLANCKALDQVLTQIFMSQTTTIVGFAFHGDLAMLKQYLPQFSFYKEITKLVDLGHYYKTVTQEPDEKPKNLGLGIVCKNLLGTEICKGERMSNWERRPLRQSQMHYAALDAYCMVPAIVKTIQMGAESGDEEKKFEKHVSQFNIENQNKEDKGENQKEGGGNPNKQKKGGRSKNNNTAANQKKIPQEESKNEKRPEQQEGIRKVFFRQVNSSHKPEETKIQSVTPKQQQNNQYQ